MWQAALGGLAGAGGGLIGGLAGGHMAQEAARELQRNQFEFQKYMCNTAYQRATADMKAAGLNPILAFGKPGASTPSGGTPGSGSGGGDATSGAVQAARAVSEIKLLKAQEAKVRQERVESGSRSVLNGVSAARTANAIHMDKALTGLHGQSAATESHRTEGERYSATSKRHQAALDARRREILERQTDDYLHDLFRGIDFGIRGATGRGVSPPWR